MLSQIKINQLIGLVQRNKITIESIKDADYRDAVQKQIEDIKEVK